MQNHVNNEKSELQIPEHWETQPLLITKDVVIGGDDIFLMAGPCSVENYDQARSIAKVLHQHGCKIIRGGAYKPRTAPDKFQGLGHEGLVILRQVADEFNMLVITEALGVEQLPSVYEYADIIQIGSRNMQHFPLLWAVGEMDKPVLLKRGFMSTIKEWLLAAEHIAQKGNHRILLCERGIRSFDPETRNTLDTNAISLLKQICPYPILGDPSHSTGRADLVLPASRAIIAAGADGLLVEFHPEPEKAFSDAEQALPTSMFRSFYAELNRIAKAMNRHLV